jgi:hypothetical protein
MSTGALPGPLRHFQAQLADLRSGGTLDMDQVGRLLVELAADQGFFAPLIAAMPADSPPSRGTWRMLKPGDPGRPNG